VNAYDCYVLLGCNLLTIVLFRIEEGRSNCLHVSKILLNAI
jgi:hypothetical protein